MLWNLPATGRLEKEILRTIAKGRRADFSPQQFPNSNRHRFAALFSQVRCCGLKSALRSVRSSVAFDGDADDLARLAFSAHFKRPAADLAIRGETLAGDAGVEDELGLLSTKRALNGSRSFHVA